MSNYNFKRLKTIGIILFIIGGILSLISMLFLEDYSCKVLDACTIPMTFLYNIELWIPGLIALVLGIIFGEATYLYFREWETNQEFTVKIHDPVQKWIDIFCATFFVSTGLFLFTFITWYILIIPGALLFGLLWTMFNKWLVTEKNEGELK